MIVYWIPFLVPALLAFTHPKARSDSDGVRSPLLVDGKWLLVIAVLIIVIGLRFEVGGDWNNYARQFDRIRYESLTDILTMSDPGYQLASWASLNLGMEIYGVNLVCAAVFTSGLVAFCRSMQRAWLALAIAVPYVVIVLGMGYTRQGVALGCAMLGLVALKNQRVTVFLLWVLVGATFHKTAVLLLPIAGLANSQRRFTSLMWVAAVTALAYILLLKDSAETIFEAYVGAEIQSEGAMVRLLMNAVPAAILLLFQRRFLFSSTEARLWRVLAVVSLVLLAVLFVSPSSTTVDRLALYMLPLQLVVFSRIPDVFGHRTKSNQAGVGAVLLYYALVLFVWLNFATHAEYWVPYKFYPFESGV